MITVELALCRHRHAIEWEHGRATPCHDCTVLADAVQLAAAIPLHGGKFRVCPGCGADLMRVGLPRLAYVFVTCTCRDGKVDHDHLVEQLWHTDCLRASAVAA